MYTILRNWPVSSSNSVEPDILAYSVRYSESVSFISFKDCLASLTSPAAQDLAGKVKDARQSLKEMKDTLSEYLTEYARMSGSTEFEDETGQLRKIVYMAKLIKQ
jgi:aminoglycoside/choline kinase family phosphotransferase